MTYSWTGGQATPPPRCRLPAHGNTACWANEGTSCHPATQGCAHLGNGILVTPLKGDACWAKAYTLL